MKLIFVQCMYFIVQAFSFLFLHQNQHTIFLHLTSSLYFNPPTLPLFPSQLTHPSLTPFPPSLSSHQALYAIHSTLYQEPPHLLNMPMMHAMAGTDQERGRGRVQKNAHHAHHGHVAPDGAVARRIEQWNGRVALKHIEGGNRDNVRGQAKAKPAPAPAAAPPSNQAKPQVANPQHDAAREKRSELRTQYNEMKADVQALQKNQSLWREGKHYRSVLGLPHTARSKEVIAELKRKLEMWCGDGVERFYRQLRDHALLPDRRLPWSGSAAREVAALYTEMKRDVKERIADAERLRAPPPPPAAAPQPTRAPQPRPAPRQVPAPPAEPISNTPIEAEDIVQAVPVDNPRPPLMVELFPFHVSVNCAGSSVRRSGSAPHTSVVSGVFAGLPVTGVPQVAQRIVTWPDPLVWNECYNGNLDAVKRLVRDDPSLLDNMGYMKTKPTQEIAESQRLGIRRMRPDTGTRYVHAVLPAPMGDDSRATPLHYAVIGNQIETVRWLLKKGASLDLCGQQGFTALHLANKPERAVLLKMMQKEKTRRDNNAKGVLHRFVALFD